jgi:hypothetical protein
MNLKVIYYIGILVFLLILSHLSSYKIPDLSAANIDSVLILTPYGIIKNFIIGNSEFYFKTPPLRYENIWRNLSIYFPLLFFSYSLIFEKDGQ